MPADGKLPEKVAQQSVRLAGDHLEALAVAAAQADAGDMPTVASETERWQQMAAQVLQPAVQHASALIRAAAQAVISALSAAVLAALPPTLQRQLLAWCCNAVAADDASPVRAAAAKAVGAMADAPALCTLSQGGPRCAGQQTWLSHNILVPPSLKTSSLPTAAGPEQLMVALSAASRDTVLAVRLPAAASLATFCSMLNCSAATDPAVQAAAQAMFPGCLQLALVAATADNDKLRPSGLQALGSLAALAGALPPAAVAAQGRQLADVVAAVSSSFASKSARVQWAASEAAGALLGCDVAPVQQHCAALLQQLLVLLRECPNFRSRAQAAGALLRLSSWAALDGSSSRAVQVLDAVAVVLFQGALRCSASSCRWPCARACVSVPAGRCSAYAGCNCCRPAGKANEFSVSALGAATAAQRSEGEPAPRQDPGELGSKAQLEAALVAAVLHLLSLLPLAGSLPTGSSSQLANIAALVQQAQRELLLPAGLAVDEAAQTEGAAAVVYYDLSQASPQLISAALDGLALL